MKMETLAPPRPRFQTILFWGQILYLLYCLNLPSSLGSLFSFFFNIINFASFKWTTKSMILHLRQYDDAFQLSLTPLSPARP